MVHTRSDIIATLRSRNVKGSLTKMKKARLLELLREAPLVVVCVGARVHA